MKTRDEKVKAMMDQISTAYSDPDVKKSADAKKILLDSAKELEKSEDVDLVSTRLCKKIATYCFSHPKEPLRALVVLHDQVKHYAVKYDTTALTAMLAGTVWF
ncbi:bacteriocin immunity protein [Companilactobacillus nodensis]|uniref:Prebacteriocin n=1 Tax=Companilactobacillus nodensis DSM 19682 = JCM 14932 = NBRC 107160 TaxID=1423775 RepID=A0A0R1KL03_9LACO|nr:bacteriocin immunity protein [Companilactobacillus nodensis]KRK81313.1 hypothetical protein FD03_GL000906 [Companilactobacillus nodensis DSM 19682 = JCM 14932 = NBRC 107160]